MQGIFDKEAHCKITNGVAVYDVDDEEKPASQETIVFIHHNTGLAECYDYTFLYESIRSRGMENWKAKKERPRFNQPIFKLSYTNINVDYKTVGFALSCGFNTIYVAKSSKIDSFEFPQLEVFQGFPIRRKTFLSGNKDKMMEDVVNFEKGKFIYTKDDFFDLSSVPSLPPIPIYRSGGRKRHHDVKAKIGADLKNSELEIARLIDSLADMDNGQPKRDETIEKIKYLVVEKEEWIARTFEEIFGYDPIEGTPLMFLRPPKGVSEAIFNDVKAAIIDDDEIRTKARLLDSDIRRVLNNPDSSKEEINDVIQELNILNDMRSKACIKILKKKYKISIDPDYKFPFYHDRLAELTNFFKK